MSMGLDSSAHREDQRIEHCAIYGQKDGGDGDVDLQHSSVKTTTTRLRGAGGCADARLHYSYKYIILGKANK